jgi:hypothetical protein
MVIHNYSSWTFLLFAIAADANIDIILPTSPLEEAALILSAEAAIAWFWATIEGIGL